MDVGGEKSLKIIMYVSGKIYKENMLIPKTSTPILSAEQHEVHKKEPNGKRAAVESESLGSISTYCGSKKS